MIHLYALSSILTALTSIAIVALLCVKGCKSKSDRIWVVFVCGLAIHGFGAYFASTAKDAQEASFWWQVSYIGIIMLPALFLHFVYSFLDIKRPILVRFTYTITLLILASDIFSKNLFVGHVSLLFTDSKWFKSLWWIYPPGPLHIFHTLFMYFGLLTWAYIELIRGYKKADTIKKQQIKYFIIATSLGFLGGTSYLPCFGINLYPVLNVTVPLHPLIMTYAIVRYRQKN